MAPALYFDASYGGIPLLIGSLETSTGRDIVVQSPERGDDHTLDDRGRKVRSTSVTLRFVDQPGQDDYLTRLDRIRELAETAGAQDFSHPILGTYSARMGDFSFRVDADELSAEATATIIAESAPQLVFPSSAGTSGEAGLEAVTTAAAIADTQLAAVGLSSPVPSLCAAAATSWLATLKLDSQAVFSALATLTGQIATAVDTLQLATDLGRWQAYQAMIGLSYQVARASEAVTSAADRMFDLTVTVAQPMRAICARIYGAAFAEDRAQQVATLNRIRTPGRVPPGTRLKMPSEGASP